MGDEVIFEKKTVESKLFDNFGYRGKDYVAKYALDKTLLIDFLKDSQPDEYNELHQHVSDEEILNAVYNEIEEKGIIHTLLNVIDIKPPSSSKVSIRVFVTKPNNNANPSEWELYKKNRFFVQKELLYKEKALGRIDVSIGVNGLHLFAVELKTGTKQSYIDAENQFKTERDHSTPYFKHIIACFAMDRTYISFCTNLNLESKFLPFNEGFDGGAGNPPRTYPQYPVQYFWQEIMTKDGITNLIQNYIYVDSKKGMIFPRYHQFNCTNKIVSDALVSAEQNNLHNYLIQAAPGSGKTLMIAWTAYKLSYLNDENNKKVFDKVIVVSNRLIINSQLSTQIQNLDHHDGYIVSPGDGEDLAEAINGDASIIVANLQKFLSSFDKVSGTAEKRFAVLIDEGHDSTSGEYMMAVKKATRSKSKKSIKEYVDTHKPDIDWDILFSKIVAANAQAEGKQENATYLAFTATPKKNTKELFGTPTRLPDRVKYDPFYHYSMKQAIEEGFILDVLKGYTPYDLYCKAASKTEDEKIVEVMKAAGKMTEMVNQLPEVIEEKTRIFMNFFRTKLSFMGGNAKAMIVTGAREQALEYFRAIERYIKTNRLNIKPLIAFSGSLTENGSEVTEASINNLPSDRTLEWVFHNCQEYKILVVADKYTTGFDEDYLCYMMVDNPLHGTKVVQTLSRLNRICPDYPEKRTQIIDYINDFDTVLDDFSEFYSDAKYYKKENEETVQTLCHTVDEMKLATDSEIKEAYKYIILRKYDDTDEFNSKLALIINKSKNVLDSLVSEHSDNPDEQLDYRKELIWRIRRFVHVYEVTANVRKIDDEEITGKYYYYAFFLACIKTKTVDPTIQIVKENVIFTDITIEEGETINNPNYPGNVEIVSSGGATRKGKVTRDDLKEVIKMFNERIGLSAEDKLHDELKEFLLANNYCNKVLSSADEYMDFEDAILNNSMDNRCNVYALIINHPSYPKLIKRPEFKAHWKELVLRPILQEIWSEKRGN